MFQIIAEAISIAARAAEPQAAAPRHEAPQPVQRVLVWPRQG
jgi:hypothetical protein